MLRNGANVHAKNGSGQPLVHAAIGVGSAPGGVGYSALKYVLEFGGCTESINNAGETALLVAVQSISNANHATYLSSIQTLLAHGPNVNVVDKVGRTVLGIVCARSTPDRNRFIPMHCGVLDAAVCLEVATMLICAGADVNVQWNQTDCALVLAVIATHTELVQLLLLQGIGIDG